MFQKSSELVLRHRLTKKIGSSTSFSSKDDTPTVILSTKKLKLVTNDSGSKYNEILLMSIN